MVSPFVERFLERPKGQKIAFWVGSLAVILFVYWQYVYSPVVEQKDKLEKDQDSFKSQIATEQRTIRNLPKFRAEVKALESLRQIALNQLPYRNEMDGLLESVTTLARESGLNVLRFAPGDEQLREFYAEVPIQLDFEGNFQQLMTFFDELSRLTRIVSVSSINIKNPKGYQEELQVEVEGSCKLIAYRHLDENERAPSIQKEEQSKRGRGRSAPSAAKKK